MYSVRSAYKEIQVMYNRGNGNAVNNIWKKVWSLQVPAKIKNFMWRALSDCLPTRCNLQMKMVHVCLECPLCGVAKETTNHCLIHCLFAKVCWSTICPEFYDSLISTQGWFEYVFDHLRHKADLICMVCWGIWKARNEAVWEDKSPRAGVVVNFTRAHPTQWKQVQVKGSIVPISQAGPAGNLERWTKPRSNCVKINCDSAMFPSSGCFGIGWIARDDRGDLIHAVSQRRTGNPGVVWAETVSIREVLSWVKLREDSRRGTGDNQQKHYIVESDCQIVIRAINKGVEAQLMSAE